MLSLALLSLLFLFHYKNHFAYHHTVLLCDTLIHYYLTITHFLQVPPSAHHIIYLGTFSSTLVRHPEFIFLLEISIDNRQIHLFSKIHNHYSFLISCSSPLSPHYFLIPYVSFFHMSIKICTKDYNISSVDILSINPSRSSQNSFFSSMLLLTCGVYALTIFRMDPFTSSFMAISLSDTLFTSRPFQPAPPSALSLSHFFFHQLRCRIFCIHRQCSLFYYLSTLFPVDIICLHFFAPSYLPALFPFQSSFQYLKYPPL